MNLLDLARSALTEQRYARATLAQAAELRVLIPQAFPEINESDAAEVLAVACGDPVAALTSFRLLAKGS